MLFPASDGEQICEFLGGDRSAVKSSRVLYISCIDMRQNNGISLGQRQLLQTLCTLYPGNVDLLSIGASASKARRWAHDAGLCVNVIGGIYAAIAYLNATAWYGGGVILCNKLRWGRKFRFPMRTPLPQAWIDRYDLIVSYYVWPHRLLALERGGRKVVVDTGDVMADRHERLGARRWISLDARDEAAVLRSESRCLAVSEDDVEEFHRLYGVRLRALQFLPPEYSKLIALTSGARPRRVGYIGAPSYVNEEVLKLLSAPAFLDRLAKANIELLVAGGICNTAPIEILDALRRGGARVLGVIDSLTDFYAQISAVINPVGPSTGIKIKSVEALMAGRMLITTRWGADRSLITAFGPQISLLDWPIAPDALGTAVVGAVQNAGSVEGTDSRAYAEESTRILHELLSL